jgi:hypothetical protein
MNTKDEAALMKAIAPVIAEFVAKATQPRITALAQCVTALTERVCELETS